MALSTISSTADTRNTKLGLAPFCVIGVPAAHGPMKGTFSWLAMGTMAIDTGVSSPPKSTATFSLKMSSRAAVTPLAGLPSSSRRTSSSGRPITPPLALISSMAMVMPRLMDSPARADWPESAVTRPILIGSAASAVNGMPAANAEASTAVERKRRRCMVMEGSWRSDEWPALHAERVRGGQVRRCHCFASRVPCRRRARGTCCRHRFLPLVDNRAYSLHTMPNMFCRQDSCAEAVRKGV